MFCQERNAFLGLTKRHTTYGNIYILLIEKRLINDTNGVRSLHDRARLVCDHRRVFCSLCLFLSLLYCLVQWVTGRFAPSRLVPN